MLMSAAHSSPLSVGVRTHRDPGVTKCAAPDRVVSRSSGANTAAHLTVAAVFVLTCSSPLLFSRSGFASDFTNAPWLGQLRAHQIESGGLFTYFVSGSGFSALTPLWAFYG